MLKRSPRVLGLWAGAIALAVATGAIVAGDLATLHRRAQQFGPERRVVVARRNLTLGATVTPGDVTTRRVYSSQVPSDVLDDPALALGRTVRVPVVRDAYVADANLAPARRAGLDGVLPEGTRAVRVVVEDGLRPPPGSAVDVYVSFASDQLGTGATSRDPATVVASGVPVLATNGGGAAAGATRTIGVTLLVDEADAASIAFAITHGRIVLALVPPEDARVPGLTRR
jgi:Flp pilus assembly protein CpaB